MTTADRATLMQHLIWAYENLTAARTGFTAAWFDQAKALMDEMMVYYTAGQNTHLTLVYTPTSRSTGTLTFAHDGFVPHAGGTEEYSAALSWSATSGLTVKKNGTVINGTSAAVLKTDEITVEYAGSQSVTFTLTDSAKYLKAGTIRGDVIQNTGNINNQRLVYGHAQFINLRSAVAIGDTNQSLLTEDDISFHNIYGAEENDGNILPAVGGPGTGIFTAAAAMLASLMSLFFIGTLIYRRYKYRRWFYKLE